MRQKKQSWVVYAIRGTLLVAIVVSLWLQRWNEAFVAALTLGLTFLPTLFADRMQIRLPLGVGALISIFLFSTLFLGEVFDFYEKYWWWDVLLHSGSAMGFGLIGFVLVFIMFEGDRFAAPPIAIAALSFCFAMSIGALWEVFEFTMDQTFGMNMQKSGLVDTMWDLIVDLVGAFIGAAAGYSFLLGRRSGYPQRLIDQFIKINKRLFRKNR